MNNYTSKQYWDNQYTEIKFRSAGYKSAVYRLIKKYFYKSRLGKNSHTCFEIGCYPGSYLSVFGQFGFTISGIDTAEGTDTSLVDWLKGLNYSIGKITKGDFFSLKLTQKYDVVCSFGFIEHFLNCKDVVKKHVALVKSNGYVVITTPNFRGKIQNFLRRMLDRESLEFHNIDSMDPEKISKVLKKEGLEIVYQGYFGGFLFWADYKKINKIQRLLSSMFYLLGFVLFWLPGNKSYSPYCGVIAQKRK